MERYRVINDYVDFWNRSRKEEKAIRVQFQTRGMENQAEQIEIGFHTVQRDTKTILTEYVL